MVLLATGFQRKVLPVLSLNVALLNYTLIMTLTIGKKTSIIFKFMHKKSTTEWAAL